MNDDDEHYIGLLQRRMIVRQLTHVAALQGLTAQDLEEAGAPTWNVLAANALGLQRDSRAVELAVLAKLRERENR